MTKSDIEKLHREAVVCLSYVNPWIEYSPKGVSAHRYFTESAFWMEASIPMMRKGGVDIAIVSHGAPDKNRLPGAIGMECLYKCYDALINEIEKNDDLVLVLTKRDLDHAVTSGKMGIILGVTGSPFNSDLANLRNLFRLGVRTVHPFADDPQVGGFADGPKELGLKAFGRAIIGEMERLGMVVDLAHTNDRTYSQVLKYASRPVINSHTNCRAIADYQRCSTDAQLKNLAERGGVVGAHFGFIEVLDKVEDRRYNKMMESFGKKMQHMERKYPDPYEFLQHRNDPFEWPLCLGGAVDDGTPIHRSRLSRLGDHIEHLVRTAGIDHVCIGSDYSAGNMPEGVETAETLVNLTGEMARRGFSAGDIKKIWGENLLRVFNECLPT